MSRSNANAWTDDVRLSELDFVCTACVRRGSEVRPKFSKVIGRVRPFWCRKLFRFCPRNGSYHKTARLLIAAESRYALKKQLLSFKTNDAGLITANPALVPRDIDLSDQLVAFNFVV